MLNKQELLKIFYVVWNKFIIKNMTQEEFKKILDEEGYSYKEEDGWIIVGGEIDVELDLPKILPDNVRFNNKGNVYLWSLETLPYSVEFINSGYVDLPLKFGGYNHDSGRIVSHGNFGDFTPFHDIIMGN